MSVFTKLPQDMLQWEVACFLDHRDILSFNEVVRKNERVYKKFPADYALKHALITKRLHYETIATRLNIMLNYLNNWECRRPAQAEKELKKIFAFLKDPLNAFIFMYLRQLKGMMTRMVECWIEEDQELYEYLSDGGRELRALATETRDYIATIPFVRHVQTVAHQSAF